MLKPDFVNDLRHNYMTVLYEGTADSFALRMLTGNRTKEFLPVELRRLDGENFLYYDISGKQSMDIIYAEKPIDRNAFQTFMWNLHEAMGQSEELFLPENGICVEPAMLFWSFDEQRWMYAYLPDRARKDTEAVQKERERLAEFFVMQVDYEDKDLTEAVYRFYEEICAGQMYPENFLRNEEVVDAKAGKKKTETERPEKEGLRTGGLEKEGLGIEGLDIGGLEKEGLEIEKAKTENESKTGIRAGEREGREEGEWEEQIRIRDIWNKKEHTGFSNRYPEKEKRRKAILLILLFISVVLTFFLSKDYQSAIVPGGMICIVLSGLLLRILIKPQPDCVETPKEDAWQEKEIELEENMEPPENNIMKSDNWYEKEIKPERTERMRTEGIPEKILKGNPDEAADETFSETYDNRTVYIDIQKEQERKLYGIGKFRQQKILLHRLPCVIGKDRSLVDFAISDSSISRMHVRIFEERGQLWMQDLNSTNGTYHNGLRLKPNERVLLEPEDEVGIGRAQFVYR